MPLDNEPMDRDQAARTLFGDTLNRENKISSEESSIHLDPKDEARANELWRTGLNQLELSDEEGARVTKLVKTAVNEPIPESQQLAWRETTQTALKREFGNGDEYKIGSARHRLSLAKKLLDQNPAAKKMIADNGLGDHPELTRLILDKAWSLRAAGRLK